MLSTSPKSRDSKRRSGGGRSFTCAPATLRTSHHPNQVTRTMKKMVSLLLTGLFLVAAQASAQQKTVTGKVTSEQGTPLPDATIILKGTATRATSDAEGNYTIQAQ